MFASCDGDSSDANGVTWFHSYLVWPHYTIYATLALPKGIPRAQANWALNGVASIRLRDQMSVVVH